MGLLQQKKESFLSYKGLKRETGLFVHEAVIEIIRKTCNMNAKILDLGAGDGAFSQLLIDSGFKNVEAADINEQRFNAKNNFLKINLTQQFSKKIKKKYDCIVAIEVIEHMDNPINFLKECRKITKESGHILLTTPNIHSLKSRTELFLSGELPYFKDENYVDYGHKYPLTTSFFKYVGKKLNLKLINIYTPKIPKRYTLEFSPFKRLTISIFSLILSFFQTKTSVWGDNIIILFER